MTPREARSVWAAAANGVVRVGPEAEEDTYLCGGHFSFDDTKAQLLLDVLPPLVHVRAAEHADRPGRPTGWLGALNDDGIGAALRAMHADTAHRWAVRELAEISHMSRSAFAASFRSKVGTAPLEYLIEWRMSLARDALRRGTRSVSELAFATGYESESAFSTAFRRVVGSSPTQFRDASRRRGHPGQPPGARRSGPPQRAAADLDVAEVADPDLVPATSCGARR